MVKQRLHNPYLYLHLWFEKNLSLRPQHIDNYCTDISGKGPALYNSLFYRSINQALWIYKDYGENK